jgi:hypothetical protein
MGGERRRKKGGWKGEGGRRQGKRVIIKIFSRVASTSKCGDSKNQNGAGRSGRRA